MFDKRHYETNPAFKKLREDQAAEQQKLLDSMAAAPQETPEQLRRRARNLGNRKTKNASGRRWWENR